MIERLLLLIRDLFPYPAEYGNAPGERNSLIKLLNETSHSRPLLQTPCAMEQQRINIQSQKRSIT